jgi:hyaluronoglucosaminidase
VTLVSRTLRGQRRRHLQRVRSLAVGVVLALGLLAAVRPGPLQRFGVARPVAAASIKTSVPHGVPRRVSPTSARSVAGVNATASSPAALPTVAVRRSTLPASFLGGVVEGFYGPRWSAATTVHMIRFMASRGLNTFVYAPKNDPYQRVDWATPYPASQLGYLKTIVAAAQAAHVRFVYSVSPGLSITYSSAPDRAALLAKINQIRALGVHWFMLSFDDVPPALNSTDAAVYHGSLGAAQASLLNFVWADESSASPRFGLILTPTTYDGLASNPYWAALKQDLTPHALVAWTGPDVLSPTITAADARTVAAELGHRLVIWDNYPVNDYTYVQQHAPRLMLGPLTGRSPNLPAAVAGYLFNPMLQARASEVALFTGAAYLTHPHQYHPLKSWKAALHAVGGPAAGALQTLAEASDTSFLPGSPAGPGDAGLTRAIVQVEAGGPNVSTANLSALSLQFTQLAQVNQTLRTSLPDPRLYAEVAPWATQLSLEGSVGTAAVFVLTNLHHHLPTASAVAQLQRLAAQMQQSAFTVNTTAAVNQLVQWTEHAAGA